MSTNDAATPVTPTGLGEGSRSIARFTYRLALPVAGRRLFPIYALVRHRGRRSGREYSVPVAIRATDDAFFIPTPWAERTQWVQNVLAAGGCTLRWKGHDHVVDEPVMLDVDDVPEVFGSRTLASLRAAGVRRCIRLRRRPDAT